MIRSYRRANLSGSLRRCFFSGRWFLSRKSSIGERERERERESKRERERERKEERERERERKEEDCLEPGVVSSISPRD